MYAKTALLTLFIYPIAIAASAVENPPVKTVIEDPPQTHLIGAVTTGRSWEFVRLNRQSKHIEQGLEVYDFLKNFDALIRILVQVVINK